MTFSDRTFWNLAENDLTAATRIAREQGRDLLDLTISNPTACGFDYPTDLLTPLASPSAQIYTPDPLGTPAARSAVATYYRDLGADIPLDRICLTTSTSEAYSFLFRLLCNPGDEVLAARPSYPLFDFIARLDDVILREYPLHYDPNALSNSAHGWAADGWSIDLEALAAAITPRTRAILLVHPNNPTGNFASDAERIALQQLCLHHNLALIVDEVFLDYALTPGPTTFAAADSPCLTFILSGLSKICGLPQMKCSWIISSGPDTLLREALARIEVIADTFLSMNAPIQAALPTWLAQRPQIQSQILTRMRSNIAYLDAQLQNTTAQRLAFHGGWTTILRVPRTVNDIPFAHAALARNVLVQPGEFYGLPEGRAVLSLLTPPNIWSAGIAKLPID
jgi:aspartate/methionine/tyrosine aminotransferase